MPPRPNPHAHYHQQHLTHSDLHESRLSETLDHVGSMPHPALLGLEPWPGQPGTSLEGDGICLETKKSPRITADGNNAPPLQSMRLPCDMMRLVCREVAHQVSEGLQFQDSERALMCELGLELQKFAQSLGNSNAKFAQSLGNSNADSNGCAFACEKVSKEVDLPLKLNQNDDRIGQSERTISADASRALTPLLKPQKTSAVSDPSRCEVANRNIEALLEVFHELDADSSGFIAREELRAALNSVHVPLARCQKLLKIADADNSGEISFTEWRKAIEGQNRELAVSLAKLMERQKSFNGTRSFLAVDDDEVPHYWGMLQPHGHIRVFWDLIMVVCMAYLAIILPFNLAWGKELPADAENAFEGIDWGLDIFFWCDVVLNFRTGYIDLTGNVVMEPRAVTLHYLRTWFGLDVLSSAPLDRFTPLNSQLMKLGKVGKIARVLKILRPSRSFNEVFELMDDFTSSFMQRCKRRTGIMVSMVLLCHWLACGYKYADKEALLGYQDVSEAVFREYLACLYWSMTTLTTVGYGDIIPSSDMERLYAMFAMIIGGTFYGYVVGTISAIIANKDLNVAAYYDRMDQVHAWMEFHKFPRVMRRRIRNHFKTCFSDRAAVAEADIFDELSPTLREDTGIYLIKEEVTSNPIFDGLATSVVVRLQKILKQILWEEQRAITTMDESGTAMYLIIDGKVEKTMKGPDGIISEKLSQGDSFGEEVLLGLKEKYEYTTTAITPVAMHMIIEEDFEECFRAMPDVREHMRQNLLEMM